MSMLPYLAHCRQDVLLIHAMTFCQRSVCYKRQDITFSLCYILEKKKSWLAVFVFYLPSTHFRSFRVRSVNLADRATAPSKKKSN